MGQHTNLRRFQITEEYSISSLIVGGWQFSEGHGAGTYAYEEATEFFARLVDHGLTTFDCADIYRGVEELFGSLLRQHRKSGRGTPIQVHTKFVPDLQVLADIEKSYVERIVNRSLTRLGVERLDLVQFHWWDFGVPNYLEVIHWMKELQEEGKIRHLGVTNFDQEHLDEVVSSGVDIVSNQVQYSALDRRPNGGLAQYSQEKGIVLLCYGALAGGFLTDQYLSMSKPPSRISNRSLVKYHLIIDEIGGWNVYQEILQALHSVAERHHVPTPCIALRYVLDQPGVAATITGMESDEQASQLVGALDLSLGDEEWKLVNSALELIPSPPGPVYGLEREIDGPHGAIMRYDLNQE